MLDESLELAVKIHILRQSVSQSTSTGGDVDIELVLDDIWWNASDTRGICAWLDEKCDGEQSELRELLSEEDLRLASYVLSDPSTRKSFASHPIETILCDEPDRLADWIEQARTYTANIECEDARPIEQRELSSSSGATMAAKELWLQIQECYSLKPLTR